MAELKTNTYNLGGTNFKYTKLLWRGTNKIQRNDKRYKDTMIHKRNRIDFTSVLRTSN